MNTRNPHQALKTEVIEQRSFQDVHFLLAKLQWSKDDIGFSLHAEPRSWSTYGLQTTDFLSMLGFRRGPCSFGRECYSLLVNEDLKLDDFTDQFHQSFDNLLESQKDLEKCGFILDQPEGWSYFFGKRPSGNTFRFRGQMDGDGHTAMISQFMKKSEDDAFSFVFTWLKNDEQNKGWIIHYKPKHLPLSSEIQSAFRFLGIKSFEQCPQYDFEECSWRSIAFVSRTEAFFESNADVAHKCFDAHAEYFSSGIQKLLGANGSMERFGLGSLQDSAIRLEKDIRKRIAHPKADRREDGKVFDFDVALSFAGSERKYAEELASQVKAAGFSVFYDDFYPEYLWGKDLATTFDQIYRKRSRYCVMFVSAEYSDSVWTIHERRSAQARALKEKGKEYILPVKVDDSELDGMLPTTGYISLDKGISKISDILIKKLKKDL